MTYNISFDIATIAMLSVLFVALRTAFYTPSFQSSVFRRFVTLTIVNAILDIITAFTISYSVSVNDNVNQFLNTLYQFSSAFTVYYAIRYVFVYLDCTRKINIIINHVIGSLYLGLLAINAFSGIIFRFENHTYIHGPLFFSTYILSFLLVIHAFITTIVNRKSLIKSKYRIVLFFLTLPIVFSISQMLIGDVLLTAFGEAFASLIMLFSLETPDYNKLLATMEELKIARQEADIANSSKSDFLANMSHEIRTPINGILGMDTMILRESDDPQIKEYAENIRVAGNGLLSIINDILDLSKIESGKMELVPVEYELFSILNECYQMFRMRAEEKGLKLTFTNNQSIPSKFIGDEVRIRQIINNLLSNAIKYSNQGEVNFNIDYESANDDNSNNIMLVIEVSDTGIGIKEEDKAKLFESFSRLEHTRNRNIEGTGLGLRITKQFVTMMAGTIDFTSVYGEGTTFTVAIPQECTDTTPLGDFEKIRKNRLVVSNTTTDNIAFPGSKILVVDDVKMNIIVFKGLLKGTMLEIDTAMSGKECLERISTTKYDAIYMDHLMPEMDGVETLHKMRETNDSINKETPVVVLTANALVGAKDMYINEGFCGYLTKPIERNDLINSIQSLL